MQWRKWRNWRKIASRWRFELDAKSGPLEAGNFGENGDFGEIGDFGKNRHACNGENGETGEKSPASGDLNWMPKVAPWRLAILAKMAILVILAKIAMHVWQKSPACNGENGETGEKSPASGDFNWMPKVAPWRLAILAKMAILAKCGKIFKLDAKSGPFKVDN